MFNCLFVNTIIRCRRYSSSIQINSKQQNIVSEPKRCTAMALCPCVFPARRYERQGGDAIRRGRLIFSRQINTEMKSKPQVSYRYTIVAWPAWTVFRSACRIFLEARLQSGISILYVPESWFSPIFGPALYD